MGLKYPHWRRQHCCAEEMFVAVHVGGYSRDTDATSDAGCWRGAVLIGR